MEKYALSVDRIGSNRSGCIYVTGGPDGINGEYRSLDVLFSKLKAHSGEIMDVRCTGEITLFDAMRMKVAADVIHMEGDAKSVLFRTSKKDKPVKKAEDDTEEVKRMNERRPGSSIFDTRAYRWGGTRYI
jgi:hypothetical protein